MQNLSKNDRYDVLPNDQVLFMDLDKLQLFSYVLTQLPVYYFNELQFIFFKRY